ncbi:DUF927 domain-containing protein [Xanthobacter sp. VNH20]|uniref:DUF927 domain-containing protein n=1 Tax=Xanthobacter sp. VNH20 TaxID=3156616 RepID=UPI0032B3C606
MYIPNSQPNWLTLIELRRDFHTGEFTAVLGCASTDGEALRISMPRSWAATPGKVLAHLLAKGVAMPTDMRLCRSDVEKVLTGTSAPIANVTSRIGWHGTCFVLPDMTIGRDANELKFDGPASVAMSPVAGTFEGWKASTQEIFAASSVLTLMAAAACAAPLLDVIEGQDIGLLHISGGTADERELALLWALSMIENPTEANIWPVTDLTKRGRPSAGSGSPLIRAVSTRQVGGDLKARRRALTAAAAAAGPAGDSTGTQAAHASRATALIISIDTYDPEAVQDAQGTGMTFLTLAKGKGLFDFQKGPKARTKLLRRAVKTIRSHHGHLLREFVHALVADGGASQKVEAAMAAFEAKTQPYVGQEGAQMAKAFAFLVGVGSLAAEHNVVPFTAKHLSRCALRVFKRALKPTAEQRAEALLRRVAAERLDDVKFPVVAEGDTFPSDIRDTALGFRRKLNGQRVVAIFRHRLDDLVAPAEQKEILRQWQLRGVLMPGKDALHHVRQVKMKGFSTMKPYVLCLRYEGLVELAAEVSKASAADQ